MEKEQDISNRLVPWGLLPALLYFFPPLLVYFRKSTGIYYTNPLSKLHFTYLEGTGSIRRLQKQQKIFLSGN